MISKRFNKNLLVICVMLCVAMFGILAPTYVLAQTEQSNVLEINYTGSSNSVSCGLYVIADSVDIHQSPMQTAGTISVKLIKDNQNISFPIGIKLTGTITLYYTATNAKLKETSVSHTFDCLNKSFTQTIFTNNHFNRGNGEYTIVVDLTYTQSAWSSSYNQIITIDHTV